MTRGGVHDDAWRWRLAWLVGLVLALLMAAIAGYRATPQADASDFRDFWENGTHFRETGRISSELGVHSYLPFFTIFMTPWSLLPMPMAAALFVLLSLLLTGLTAWMIEALLSDGDPRDGPRPALLLALGLALPYIYACAVVGNVGLLLLFLIIACWFLVERGHEWEAGIALGLAVLIKLLPLVLVGFFLLKRRWRVAGSALATIVVLGLGLPMLLIGPKQTLADHQSFYDRAAAGNSAVASIRADVPVEPNYSNNAVPLILRRLLSPLNSAKGDGVLHVNVADVPRETIVMVYFAFAALVAAASVVAAFRPPTSWRAGDLTSVSGLRAQFAAWCCVMLLASPLVWTHYFPLAYFPLALAADRAIGRGNTGVVLAPALVLGAWGLGVILLAWPAARAAGAQMAPVLVLFVFFVALSLRRSPARTA